MLFLRMYYLALSMGLRKIQYGLSQRSFSIEATLPISQHALIRVSNEIWFDMLFQFIIDPTSGFLLSQISVNTSLKVFYLSFMCLLLMMEKGHSMRAVWGQGWQTMWNAMLQATSLMPYSRKVLAKVISQPLQMWSCTLLIAYDFIKLANPCNSSAIVISIKIILQRSQYAQQSDESMTRAINYPWSG